jgi:putative transposase
MCPFERGSHSLGLSNFHLQFTPKYRRKVFLDPVIRATCKRSFEATASRLGVRVAALEFGPDHVHMFVEGSRTHSASELARVFKGASARALREECWPRVRKMLWGRSFWTAGYFYESVGRVTSDNIRHYIERQQGHHWEELGLSAPGARGHPDQAELREF